MPDPTPMVGATVQATRSDLLLTVAELARRSRWSLLIGSGVVTVAALSLWVGVPFDLNIAFMLVFGLAMLTGLLIVPFQLWAISRRPDLTVGPISVRADEEGITLGNATVQSRQAWSMFRHRFETDRAFVFQTGVSTSVMPKRGMTPDQLRVLQDLLARHGGLLPLTTLGRTLRWCLAGAVLGFAPIVVAVILESR